MMMANRHLRGNCLPRAALFQFCMAVVAHNCRQVLLAALYAEHEQVEQMSQYQVALDVVRPLKGMLTALPTTAPVPHPLCPPDGTRNMMA
jgi:hypothetical protein